MEGPVIYCKQILSTVNGRYLVMYPILDKGVICKNDACQCTKLYFHCFILIYINPA